MRSKKVLERIEEIKRMYGVHPQCYLVGVLLVSHFKGTIYYNGEHCITFIYDNFYDRNGVVSGADIPNLRYIPMAEYGIIQESILIDAMVNSLK